MEAIALHVASTFGGAQFYISCGQVEVTNGGSGSPGPLVAIPGVYTGYVCFLCNYPCLECIVTLPWTVYRSPVFSLTSTTPSRRTILSPVP